MSHDGDHEGVKFIGPSQPEIHLTWQIPVYKFANDQK